MTPDDCAYKGRPILSPDLYKEFIIPQLKKYVDMAHRAGKLTIFHSDGMVEPYYTAFIEIGLDCHQSLEPVAGNNLAIIKEKWGDKLSFIGNMDSEVLLPFGSTEEVIAVTKATLKAGMPNGGYMFSPCTDLTDSCKLENVEVMMATYKKYCQYPINIP
jgi:uroporphyrinogen decarboxylase